jgi:hypothetical protein
MTTNDGSSTKQKQKDTSLPKGHFIDRTGDPFQSEADVQELDKMIEKEKRKLAGQKKVEGLQKERRLPGK